MRTRRRPRLATLVAAGAFSLLVALGSATAGAEQAGPAQQELDQDALDRLRALIPEGEPGEFDLQAGDGLYGAVAAEVGASTNVEDFGSGSELRGPCGGIAISYDDGGHVLDAAFDSGDDAPPVDLFDGGQAFTSGNRFKVDTNGVVVYYGFMPQEGDGPLDHSWEIKTSGISLDSGGDPNANAKNRSAGIVDLAKDLPVKFNANVRISGELTSDNLAPCIGKGHVEFRADPLVNPVAFGGIAALAGGILGLLFNARPARTWRA